MGHFHSYSSPTFLSRLCSTSGSRNGGEKRSVWSCVMLLSFKWFFWLVCVRVCACNLHLICVNFQRFKGDGLFCTTITRLLLYLAPPMLVTYHRRHIATGLMRSFPVEMVVKGKDARPSSQNNYHGWIGTAEQAKWNDPASPSLSPPNFKPGCMCCTFCVGSIKQWNGSRDVRSLEQEVVWMVWTGCRFMVEKGAVLLYFCGILSHISAYCVCFNHHGRLYC